MAEQPGQPRLGVGQAQHAEAQRGAGERTADRHDVDGRTVGTGAELLGHVCDDPAVGRGRGGEHGNRCRHPGDEVAQAPVVGPEVVPPVADAVRLVDDEQADALHEGGQLLFAERRVVQALGRDQEHVDLVGGQLGEHVVPLVRVRGVDGDGAHPGTGGRRDLVAHEGEQRGDQDGGAGTALAQQQGGDEVDGRLAPPRALHDEGPSAGVDERLDGLELAVVELGLLVADQSAEHGEGGILRRFGHPPMLAASADSRAAARGSGQSPLRRADRGGLQLVGHLLGRPRAAR